MNHSEINFTCPVIYYHSVGPVNKNWSRNYLTIEHGIFEQHLKYLSSKYSIITLKDLWLIRKGKKAPVKNPLIINFDDGYLDNFIWAFPVLKKYNVKATIFISPEFADQRLIVRSGESETGFLSWDEMKIMEESGLIDIQSHTMSHTKYFVSGKIIDFHNPNSDFLYPVGNIYPSKKPYYIGNKNFEKLVPYGFPFFEEASAVIARKVEINPDFIQLCVNILKDFDFEHYNFNEAFRIIKPYYYEYLTKGTLIIKRETEEEYKKRVHYEIFESKRIIEGKLNKKVEFLCWPHGDNNEYLHQLALQAGYLMTTTGKSKGVKISDITRIPERMGIDFSTWYRKRKTIFKLKAFSVMFPNSLILKLFRFLRSNIFIKQ